MDIKQQLELDIINFFKQIDTQNNVDQKETLKNLMNKYIHLTKADFMMEKYDLEVIVSNAKNLMANKTFPVYLGSNKRKVFEDEQTSLCIIESTVTYLNKNECLKKLPRFDYREDKF